MSVEPSTPETDIIKSHESLEASITIGGSFVSKPTSGLTIAVDIALSNLAGIVTFNNDKNKYVDTCVQNSRHFQQKWHV